MTMKNNVKPQSSGAKSRFRSEPAMTYKRDRPARKEPKIPHHRKVAICEEMDAIRAAHNAAVESSTAEVAPKEAASAAVAALIRSGDDARSLFDVDGLRWKVFDLVCKNLTDEAIGIAGDALQDQLSMGLLSDELLRPVIEHDNGFWLDQLARSCFNLEDRDWDEDDWEGLLKEIAASVRKNSSSRKAPPKKKRRRG